MDRNPEPNDDHLRAEVESAFATTPQVAWVERDREAEIDALRVEVEELRGVVSSIMRRLYDDGLVDWEAQS